MPRKKTSKKKGLTSIPEGVKIKRLPPGKAKGAKPLSEHMFVSEDAAPIPKGIGVRAYMGANPKKKKSLKSKAKAAGRKAKKAAKTDVGRAGIGGGIGALALGPVGAIAGAGIAMATKKKRKKNPESTVKLSTAMGNLLLDYHKVSDNVEHVAASALRGERVEISVLKKARNDLRKAAKIQPQASEKEQINHLVDAMGRVLARHDPKTNPVRAPSLGAAVRSSRARKTRKAASGASKTSGVASEVAAASLRRKMAKINPGEYEAKIPRLSDAELDREHKALGSLIRRAKADRETSRMAKDLQRLRAGVVAEKRHRRRMAKLNPGNPGEYMTRIRKMNDVELNREHRVLLSIIREQKERVDRKNRPLRSARVAKDMTALLEEVVAEKRRRRKPNPVEAQDVTDKTLAKLTKDYQRKRASHLRMVASPASASAVDRSKAKLDDAQGRLILYAQVRNMDPEQLRQYIEFGAKKPKRAAAKSNPTARSWKKSMELAQELPHLGTLTAYPRAVNMWESVYINARANGKSRASATQTAWSAVEDVGYYRDSKGNWRMPRRRFNPSEHPKKNPLQKVPKRATDAKMRAIISKNIATEMRAGRPQKQAVAIALASARRDAPKLMAKTYGPSPNPYLGDAVALAKAKQQQRTKRKRKTPPPLPMSAMKRSSASQRANPGESWLSSFKGKASRMSDCKLCATYTDWSGDLARSADPKKEFGTEGLPMLKKSISVMAKEISRRGLEVPRR